MYARCLIVIAVFFFLAPATSHAVPTSDELVNICEHALRTGYVGRRAQMCTWYVTPCDCDISAVGDMPRVCIPEGTPTTQLAKQVVEVLSELQEYRQADGARAAAQVLAVIYPCDS